MLKNYVRPVAAASLWVAALCLMAFRSLGHAPPELTGWSILMALAGCSFTVWHLLIMERARTEEIARVAAVAAIERVRLESVK